jgi:hypothetical protein
MELPKFFTQKNGAVEFFRTRATAPVENPRFELKPYYNMVEGILKSMASTSTCSAEYNNTISDFKSFKNEQEIKSKLKGADSKLKFKENDYNFLSLVYKKYLLDCDATQALNLINNELFFTVYEFKEDFSNKREKLALIYRVLIYRYINNTKTNNETLDKLTKKRNFNVTDNEGNIIAVRFQPNLKIYYIRNSDKLQNVFGNIKAARTQEHYVKKVEKLSWKNLYPQFINLFF